MLNKLKKYFHENQDVMLGALAAANPTGAGWEAWYLNRVLEKR